MRRVFSSLQVRLVAGFAIVLTAALLSVGWYVSWESESKAEHSESRRMEVRAEKVREAIDDHFSEGGWKSLQPNVERLGRLVGARVLVWDANDSMVADSHKFLGARLPDTDLAWGAKLVTEGGEHVGSVALVALSPFLVEEPLEPEDSDLARHVSGALLWAGLAAGGLGLIAVGVLSRRALSPVRDLSAATEKLGRGDLSQRVKPSSQDEIGRLGQAFNRMAEDLEAAERQRRALLADVAHELRTPLSNIGGYVEAMRDGLAQPTAANLEIVEQQVAQLTRLVEDLRLLTQVESGALELHIESEDMSALLASVVEAFGPRAAAKGVSISYAGAPEIPRVAIDRGRIQQALHNLVENAVTHTPQGGSITLSATGGAPGLVRVSVQDTGSGIPPEVLDSVFDRLYRVDPSRSRDTGGRGPGSHHCPPDGRSPRRPHLGGERSRPGEPFHLRSARGVRRRGDTDMSDETRDTFEVRTIGVVSSDVGEGDEMPIEGVPASIELYPEYEAGLAEVDSNTHLIILGWFHRANRDSVTLSRHGGSERGVFGLRSPGRPNPIGLTSAKVLGVEGRVVKLDRLDMYDGTPVVDIKRYSPGWDAIFSARTSRDTERPGGRDRASFLRDMVVEAVNFHGELCAEIALGARMVDYAIHHWGIAKKAPELKVRWGPNGRINDALQAITGATSGNGRLEFGHGPGYTLSWSGRTLRFNPPEGLTVEQALDSPPAVLGIQPE